MTYIDIYTKYLLPSTILKFIPYIKYVLPNILKIVPHINLVPPQIKMSRRNISKDYQEFQNLLKELQNNVRDRRWSDIHHEEKLKEFQNDVQTSFARFQSLEEKISKKLDSFLMKVDCKIDKALEKFGTKVSGSTESAVVQNKKKRKYIFDTDDSSGFSSVSGLAFMKEDNDNSSDEVEIIDTKFSLSNSMSKAKVKIEKDLFITPPRRIYTPKRISTSKSKNETSLLKK